MTIRRATPEDIPAILELERQTPELAHWSEQAYKDVFKPGAPERVLLVEKTDGTVRGFLAARFTAGECELENIVVAPGHRRGGIASKLLESLMSEARTRGTQIMFLEVRQSNDAARSFYIKQGFIETGRRQRYYNNPSEDAILYTLALLVVQKSH